MQEANPREKIINSILSCHNQEGWVAAPITSPCNYGGMAELCRSQRKERGVEAHLPWGCKGADNPCRYFWPSGNDQQTNAPKPITAAVCMQSDCSSCAHACTNVGCNTAPGASHSRGTDPMQVKGCTVQQQLCSPHWENRAGAPATREELGLHIGISTWSKLNAANL